MVTDDLLVPCCPSWCDGQHEPFLSLTSTSPATAYVITHSRALAAVSDDVAGVELVQDEPHPDMRVVDGHADPNDFPVGPRVVFWAGDHDVTVRPGELRAMASALLEAADAAEEVLQ